MEMQEIMQSLFMGVICNNYKKVENIYVYNKNMKQ